jgi:hypothetical protein
MVKKPTQVKNSSSGALRWYIGETRYGCLRAVAWRGAFCYLLQNQRNHMKKLFASLLMLAIFVPCVSFAQTTNTTTYSPQYIALLEQLLKVLEQELASIQAAAVSTTTATQSPQVSVTVTPANIAFDATSTLSWTATGATSCTLSPSPVLLATTGSQATGVLESSTTYTVTCAGASGSTSGSATVTVQPWVPPAGVKVLPAGECTFATQPCTTGPHGFSCIDDGCGG